MSLYADLPLTTAIAPAANLVLLILVLVLKVAIYRRVVSDLAEVRDLLQLAREHGLLMRGSKEDVRHTLGKIEAEAAKAHEEAVKVGREIKQAVQDGPAVPLPLPVVVVAAPWDGTERRAGDSDDGTTTRTPRLPDPEEYHP